MIVEVEVICANSVRVSWDSLDIPEITGYIVYYSQTRGQCACEISEESVISSADSVEIEGLMNTVEYQFQVAAIAELDGNVVVGQRSSSTTVTVLTSDQSKMLCHALK